jgi:hypothetical protein
MWTALLNLSPWIWDSIAVVLAHPCLETWLGELLESTSSSVCNNYTIRQKHGKYEKNLFPLLVKAELETEPTRRNSSKTSSYLPVAAEVAQRLKKS